MCLHQVAHDARARDRGRRELRVCPRSSWLKRLKIWGRKSGSMPTPVSATRIRPRPSAESTVTVTRPCFGRELDRVGQQVRRPPVVAALGHPRRAAAIHRAGARSASCFFSAAGPTVSAAACTTDRQVDGLKLHLELAGHDPRDVEQVIDELRLRLCGSLDARRRIAKLAPRPASPSRKNCAWSSRLESGVRSSWESVARKRSFVRFASSALAFADVRVS